MSMLKLVNKDEVVNKLVEVMNEKSTDVFLTITIEDLDQCIIEDDCLSLKMRDDRIVKMIKETVKKSELIGMEITDEIVTITSNDSLYTTKYTIQIRG